MTYTYDPSKLKENSLDRMRFELGDTMVAGGEDTCALSDEEITAALCLYSSSWKRVKLALVESVWRRFSYEVDTKAGPLSLSLRQREEAWRRMYEESKAESKYSTPGVSPGGSGKPYFYAGMMDNPGTDEGGGRNVP